MTTEDFDNIPILDLSHANDPTKKLLLLKKLQYILSNVGFLYISNSGVSKVTPLATSIIAGSDLRSEGYNSEILRASLS